MFPSRQQNLNEVVDFLQNSIYDQAKEFQSIFKKNNDIMKEIGDSEFIPYLTEDIIDLKCIDAAVSITF